MKNRVQVPFTTWAGRFASAVGFNATHRLIIEIQLRSMLFAGFFSVVGLLKL